MLNRTITIERKNQIFLVVRGTLDWRATDIRGYRAVEIPQHWALQGGGACRMAFA